MKIGDLKKEGWLTFDYDKNENDVIDKDIIDELAFDTWGWAIKLNVKQLKDNKYLKARIKQLDMNKIYDIKHKTFCDKKNNI